MCDQYDLYYRVKDIKAVLIEKLLQYRKSCKVAAVPTIVVPKSVYQKEKVQEEKNRKRMKEEQEDDEDILKTCVKFDVEEKSPKPPTPKSTVLANIFDKARTEGVRKGD